MASLGAPLLRHGNQLAPGGRRDRGVAAPPISDCFPLPFQDVGHRALPMLSPQGTTDFGNEYGFLHGSPSAQTPHFPLHIVVERRRDCESRRLKPSRSLRSRTGRHSNSTGQRLGPISSPAKLRVAGSGAAMFTLYEDRWSSTPKDLNQRQFTIYLRTRLSLANDSEAIDAIKAMRQCDDYAELLTAGSNYSAFTNGVILRHFDEEQTAGDLARMWTDQLSRFDAWAIHDGRADIAESMANGPTTSALRRVWSDRPGRGLPPPVTQAFLVFFPPGAEKPNRYDEDAVADTALSCWRNRSHPAFHFENGRVLLIEPSIPLITVERFLEQKWQREKLRDGRWPKRILHEIAFDSGDRGDGSTYYGRSDAWSLIRLVEEQDDEEDEDDENELI